MPAPVRTLAPAEMPVSLAETKAHLQVTTTDDDALIEALIAAATQRLDGWSGLLGRCLIHQSWRIGLAAWPSSRIIRLPFPDISEVTVSYFDIDNVEQTVATVLIERLEDERGSLIRFRQAFDFPPLYPDRSDPVGVTMVAGYGVDGDAVPAPIRQAVLLSVQHIYGLRNSGNMFLRSETVEGVGRQDFAVSEQAGKVIDYAVEALVAPFRRTSL